LASDDMVTLVFGEISTELISIVSIIGGVILLSLIAMIGGFLHSRRERLLVHAERMKALELGRDLPDDAATARLKAVSQTEVEDKAEPGEKSHVARCYSTTGYICGTGFFFAWLAASNQAVAIAIAAATGSVGVAGMICGTILAAKPTESSETRPLAHSKPRFDPEAV
jgi:hypothetical protein